MRASVAERDVMSERADTRPTAVIGLLPTRWDGPPSGHARILRGFGEPGGDVFYSEGQHSVWELRRHLRSAIANPFGSSRRNGRVTVDCPGYVPPRWLGRPLLDAIAVDS